MGRTIVKNDIQIEVIPKGLILGTLNFSPGEGEAVKGALLWASRLSGAKVLPPEVSNKQFVVKFNADGKHSLCRSDAEGSVEFTFNDLDTLMELVNDGVACHSTNLQVQKMETLRRGPRGSGVGSNSPDIFDGRN